MTIRACRAVRLLLPRDGFAGLFPSRYQSDGVDRGGDLSRFRNGRLRSAWLLVAENMVKCNMTRVVFQMVSGRQLYRHPSRLDRGYVLDKLLAFQSPRPQDIGTLLVAVLARLGVEAADRETIESD